MYIHTKRQSVQSAAATSATPDNLNLVWHLGNGAKQLVHRQGERRGREGGKGWVRGWGWGLRKRIILIRTGTKQWNVA